MKDTPEYIAACKAADEAYDLACAAARQTYDKACDRADETIAAAREAARRTCVDAWLVRQDAIAAADTDSAPGSAGLTATGARAGVSSDSSTILQPQLGRQEGATSASGAHGAERAAPGVGPELFRRAGSH